MEVVKGPDTIREQEFCRLVEQYQSALLRMCYMYLKDRALAEDAVQETFLKVFKTKHAFRGECSEKGWLMRIAVNTCHDMKRSGWFRHIDHHVTPESLQASEAMPTEPQTEAVAEILNLPPKLREVVLLYYYQNLTVQEVAQALGIKHSSVSNRLKRAREKLCETMKGEYFNE